MKRPNLLKSLGIILPLMAAPIAAKAQVFEAVHPEVEKNAFEFELLNGASLGTVARGEERSAHEIALGYGVTDFWKTVFAVEIANPEGGNGEFEAFEWENIILWPFGEGHDHDHGHSAHGSFALESAGFLLALELPNVGGLNNAAIEVGPIAEVNIAGVTTVANLTLEIPFAAGSNEGLAYALQAKYLIASHFGIGAEAFGDWENVFRSNARGKHSFGPALFSEINLGRGRALEPKVSALIGLTDNAPDAVISFNLELKF